VTSRKTSPATRWCRHPLSPADLAIAGVGLVAAFLLRLPFVLRGEALLRSDEAIVGLMAQDIAEGVRFPLFFYGQAYMGTLEAYVIALFRMVVSDPVVALRLGPLLFFAILVAVQYLMLSQWFGRAGGLVGMAALLLASPMLVQWSVSARGAYVEIMLWGTLLWWAYSRWFVDARPRAPHWASCGFLVGSGLWLNPMLIVFVLPIVADQYFRKAAAVVEDDALAGGALRRLRRLCLGLPLPLPLLALGLLGLLGLLVSTSVETTGIRTRVLLDLLPRGISWILVGVLALAVTAAVFWRFRLHALVDRHLSALKPAILAFLLGLLPFLVHALAPGWVGPASTDSLAMGIRPVWTVGQPLSYLVHGAPVLLGASPDPFIQLTAFGRAEPLPALQPGFGFALVLLNYAVGIALLLLGLLFVRRHADELGRVFRLQASAGSPAVFLLLAALGLMALYLFSTVSFNFPTIRYLVLLGVMLPGLLAALFSAGRRALPLLLVALLLLGWGLGQFGLWLRTGAPEPRQVVAGALTQRGLDTVVAEVFDAQYLSFLTEQRCRVVEFRPFWSRLPHYRQLLRPGQPTWYLLQTKQRDLESAWRQTGFPGGVPMRADPNLRAELQHLDPAQVMARETVSDGYELWLLREPIEDQSL